MVTMQQRIEALRTEKGLSRPALAAALGLPKGSVDKFETGRQTPTKDQQEKMASFFAVSLFYLRGESNDRTKMEHWADMDPEDFVDTPIAPAAPRRAAPKPQTAAEPAGGNSMFDTFLHSKSFQEMIRATLLDVLRSPEGQRILSDALRGTPRKYTPGALPCRAEKQPSQLHSIIRFCSACPNMFCAETAAVVYNGGCSLCRCAKKQMLSPSGRETVLC